MPHVRFRGERAPMTEERLVKIAGILGTNLLTESHVQHLFVLARKLIETLPAVERRSLEPLKFYCDWTLHAEMDHGPAVARLIRANRIVSEHIEHGLDVVALAKLYEDLGQWDTAARLFERGLEMSLKEDDFWKAVNRLSVLQKRRGDFEEALRLWEKAASEGHIYAYVELAKYY